MDALRKQANARKQFVHNGKTVYEWEQALEEVNLFITTPDGVKSNMIDCKITTSHIRLGLKDNSPFLDHDLSYPVVVDESYWMLDGSELNINLQKMRKGETWTSVFVGHGELDPLSQEEAKKKLMLERFQEENPGFDFSNAEFNGMAPDARTFMGGVKYT